ncbi:MAG TPA: pitrilysin family protein [Chthonomonadales bacterium]|nr:pitrilysin family protein [Chthonomonadales bacterium]
MRRTACILLLFGLCLPDAVQCQSELGTKTVKLTLPTGLRVIIRPEPDTNLIAICALVRAGIAEEQNALGIGNLVARSLFGKGINLTRASMERAILKAGGSLDVLWNPDYTAITCVTTQEAFDHAIYILAQALKNAEFDAETLDRARREVEANMERENSDPFHVAYAVLRSAMYTNSPYRLPFGGIPDTLRRVTPEMAQRFFQRCYTPQNIVIAVVGNIHAKETARTVEIYFQAFNRPAPPSRPPTPPETLPEDMHRLRRLPVHTTLILAGFTAPGLLNPDYAAFLVLDAIIGGGKSSRLFRTIREKAGIGYIVGSHTPPLARESHLLSYVEFDSARVETVGAKMDTATVEKMLVDTVRSVLSSPPTAQEVVRAKRFVIGSHALARQRSRDRAFYLGWYELMGVGYAFDATLPEQIAAVTTEDVLRVAKKYLGHCVVSVVEPMP